MTLLKALAITSLVAVAHSASAQQWQQVEFPAQVGLTESAPYSGKELPRGVIGTWVRAGATFSGPAADNRVTVTAYAKGRRISFSLPTHCDPTGRCETLAWVPAETERSTVGLWTGSAPSRVSEVSVSRSRAGSQPAETLEHLSAMIDLVEANYYRSSEVDWSRVRSEARAAAAAAPSDVQPTPAILVHVLTTLPGNQHSHVLPRISTASEVEVAARDVYPTCTAVTPNVHSLVLPSAMGLNADQRQGYVERAHACLLAQPSGTRWILDLRKSFGGHSEVMFSAVAPLLRAGRLFDWVNGQGKRVAVTLHPDGVRTGGQLGEARKLPLARRAEDLVVAWIGPGCASACEMLALVLTERPNSLVVGAATQGLATGNELLHIDDEFDMALTAGRMINGRGKVVEDKIEPQEPAGLEDIKEIATRIDRERASVR